MTHRFYLAVAVLTMWCRQLPADVFVDVGQIQLSQITTSPSPLGNQQFSLFNFTGTTNCDNMTYTVCDAINITDWTLTVNYTDGAGSHAISFGAPGQADPIGPYDADFGPYSGTGSLPWILDQSCSSGTCPPFDTTVTSATFTGSISSTTLHLYPGGDGSTVFIASPTFTVNYTPTVIFDNESNFVVFDAAELLVSEGAPPPPSATVPEPSSIWLFLSGACAIGLSGMGRRRKTEISRT